VVFFDHKALFGVQGEVPEGDTPIPFGKGMRYREGKDATVVAIGRMVHFSEAVVDKLAKEAGITCDVIDPRTTSPLDEDIILASVEKTGRLIVVDESPPRCSVAGDISSMVAMKGFDFLDAPIQLVTSAHSPVPFAPNLERAYLPSGAKIEEAIRKSVEY